MEALIVALSSNETPTWRKPQVFRNRNIESSLFVMQVFHMCQPNGESTAFLCPNGTMFNQQYFVCDWWYNLGKRASYTHTETTTTNKTQKNTDNNKHEDDADSEDNAENA